MVSDLLKNLIKTTSFLRYRFKYLINYTIIGILSIIFEVIIIKYILFFEMYFFAKVLIGFLAGMFMAYFMFFRNSRVKRLYTARSGEL